MTDNVFQKIKGADSQEQLVNRIKELEAAVESGASVLTAFKEKNAIDDAIFFGIGDGLIVTNEYGKVVRVNRQALIMLGFSEEELIGKWFSKIIVAVDEHGNQFAPDTRPETEALSTGQIVSGRVYFERKDRSLLPVNITASPIILNDRPVGLVEVFRDITKEKELENLKDNFVALASHELRTPMTAISGFVDMILDGLYGPVPESIKEPLTFIEAGSNRLIKMVNDMLNISRIESGRLQFSLTDLNISELVQQTVSSLQPIAAKKELSLNINFTNTPPVQADADSVRQIIINLIGNSLKFTNHGSITVSTNLTPTHLEVIVADTGIGISDENKVKLFGKFVQIERQEIGQQGTGLGLYLSRALAQKMGGNIWLASSEPRVGSTFIFSVPLSNSKTALEVKRRLEEESGAITGQKHLS